MYIAAAESRVLARIFGLLSEDLGELAVRQAIGYHPLELLRLIGRAFTGVFARASGGQAAAEPYGQSPILKLSVREFEIARMIADDLSDKEIAHRLEVEISTIRTHLNRIFDKLGVRRRSGVASLFARQH